MAKFSLLFTVVIFASFASLRQDCAVLTNETLQALRGTCSAVESGLACTPEQTGVALDSLAAPAYFQLSATGGAIEAVLLGNATLTDVKVQQNNTVLHATNGRGYNVNVRSGPGATYDQIGVFSFSATALADGRDVSGDWIRLQTDNGAAWIARSVVRLDGDFTTLPLVEGDSNGSVLSIDFSEASGCGAVPSGLLLFYGQETPAQVQINGVTVWLAKNVVLVETKGDSLAVHALAGETRVTSAGETENIDSGNTMTAAPGAAPVDDRPLAFDVILRLPLLAMSDLPLPCTAGLTPDSASVSGKAQPAEQSADVFTLDPTTSYPVLAQRTLNGTQWWRIAQQNQVGWVTNDSIQTLGDCQSVAEYLPSAPSTNSVSSSDPGGVIYAYLQARLQGDVGAMQTLSCSGWDAQAVIQAQSFRAMNAELQGVSCAVTSQSDGFATVACSGNIVTHYGGQTRDWPLGSYRLTQEDGEWRMCGEN